MYNIEMSYIWSTIEYIQNAWYKKLERQNSSLNSVGGFLYLWYIYKRESDSIFDILYANNQSLLCER